MSRRRQYAIADSFQQAVGGFLLAGPFVVTEEVWTLAAAMQLPQTLATIAIVFATGYVTLYKADSDRDPDREAEVVGVPVRFVSLVTVSYASVFLLAIAFGAPGTFLDGEVFTLSVLVVTLKAVSVGAVFSVIGAATADSLF